MEQQFDDWIGRSTDRHDVITARLLTEFRVTLAPFLFTTPPDLAPPGFHFGLAPALLEASHLGDDGAEARGGFMPPLPFVHRMWAGGSIEIFAALREGQRIRRRSTVTDITHREGRSGAFYVVEVLHEIAADGTLAVRERQDLVYRQAIQHATAAAAPPFEPSLTWSIDADARMLFRYSAFTFNGHRIHYDSDYARVEEGHSGVLVHGPLQATLLLNQLATLNGAVPRRMTYRCLAPLAAPQRFAVEARRKGASAEARIVSSQGVVTCQAVAD